MKRSWIPVIVFWALFPLSLALGKRYPWIDTGWLIAMFVLLVAGSVAAIRGFIWKRTAPPRWFFWFGLVDEDDFKNGAGRSPFR